MNEMSRTRNIEARANRQYTQRFRTRAEVWINTTTEGETRMGFKLAEKEEIGSQIRWR